MAKSIIIENLQEDTKDLGDVGGRRIYLGSAADKEAIRKGVVGLSSPEIEVTPEEFKQLMTTKSTQLALEGWKASRQILVIGA